MRPDASEGNTPQDSRKPESVALPEGFLADCMVDADPNTASRAGMARGRAFGISALLQACLLILFLIVPLFAVSKLTPANNVIPIAPYGGPPRHGKGAKPRETPQPPNRGSHVIHDGPIFRAPTTLKNRREANDERSRGNSDDGPILGLQIGDSNGNSTGPGLVFIPGMANGPIPPQPDTDKKPISKPIEVSQGAELGKLTYRVEPVYPIFAIHNHIEGTVELRAIIGRDGMVREVQVLSGNAFLILAARQAVLQWRFRPTLLNGQPVEVDTFFTVNFRINQ
jgi:protein TonB